MHWKVIWGGGGVLVARSVAYALEGNMGWGWGAGGSVGCALEGNMGWGWGAGGSISSLCTGR